MAETNKIEMVATARMNSIPLDFLFSDNKGVNCLEIAAQRAESRFSSRCVMYLMQDIEKAQKQKQSNVMSRMRELQANNNELNMMNEELTKRDTELKKKWLRKFKDRENEIKEENRKHKIEVQKLKEQIEKKNSQGPYNEKVTELEDMVTKLEIEKQDMKKELEQVQECLKNTTKEGESDLISPDFFEQ